MSRRTFWDEPRAAVFRCAECGEKAAKPDEIGFESRCARCASDLHSCRNCAFFDTAAERECRREIPERIPKKRANNACAEWRPVQAVDLQGEAAKDSPQDQAKRAFEALFK